jgi:hypothetical protein
MIRIHYTRATPEMVASRPVIWTTCGFGRPGAANLTRDPKAVTCLRCRREITRLGPALGA